MALTNDQAAEYRNRLVADPGRCPRCGGNELTTCDRDGNKKMVCKVTCDVCRLAWVETYQLTGITQVEDDA